MLFILYYLKLPLIVRNVYYLKLVRKFSNIELIILKFNEIQLISINFQWYRSFFSIKSYDFIFSMIEPQQTSEQQENPQNKTKSLEQQQEQPSVPQIQPHHLVNNQFTSKQENQQLNQQTQEQNIQSQSSQEQHHEIRQNNQIPNLLENQQRQADPLKQKQQEDTQIPQQNLNIEQNHHQIQQDIPHAKENVTISQPQPNEQHQTVHISQKHPDSNPLISQNNQCNFKQTQEPTKDPSTSQPPQNKSFFQSIWSFFFKPKEVATYPPNFPPPPKGNKKTLIFDLDETLIHSSDFPPHPKVLSFKMGDPPFYVFKRPGLDDFLRKYSKLFDIFIFTSGDKMYADPIINAICPYLDEQHRLFRNSCTVENNEIHKDLDAFKRPPTDIILVEDNFNLKKVRPNNTIIVQRWEGIPFDTTLIKWLPQILDDCLKAKDVRDVIGKISDNWHFNRSV